MPTYERGEVYNYWLDFYDRNGTKAAANPRKIYIYDPCGNTLVNNDDMIENATGEYYYNYDISSTATYGRYRVRGELTVSSKVNKETDEFFIMPWNIEADVRRKSGVGDAKDISDGDLSHLSWSSYKQALRDLHIHRYAEKPKCNPDDGTLWDGTNKTFQTSHHPIADINGDGSVSGNSVECNQDVDCWWIDENGAYQDATVTVNNSFNGEITITQTDTSAIPSNATGVYLEYWQQPIAYDEFLFREAVSYLGCHHLELRFESRESISIADINANQKIIMKSPSRYYKEYRRIMKMINKPKIRGV